MVSIRSWIKRLERDASEDLESFELLDSSTYYYDRLEAHKELFLYAYDFHTGRGVEWPEPPEVYRKMCEAKDPATVLERFKPENPQVALVNVADLFDTDALVHERRLVPICSMPPEDLSE